MENHIDPSTMLEFIEGLAAMAVLDQDGVYTYVSPGWERYTGHTAQEAIGRKVWEMVPDTHATEVFHTGKPVFAKAVNANGPAFTSYFPRFDRDGKLCGLFLYVIVQGMEDAQNLTRRIGELSSKVEFYQQELSRERGARYGLDNIIGESASVLRLKEQIVQAARSTSTVLIEGETGSGKELIAHSIHAMSARKAANFVRVNCSAIPAELMESEFFGYAAGAFTGAARKGRIGRFQLASGGSIFLDEVNLLTATMQPKFLRVLQEMEIDPVGGEKSIPIDVRVIAASNIPLETLVEAGQFRSDLYYRLNVVSLKIPALAERTEDIPLLANHLLRQAAERHKPFVRAFSTDAMKRLMTASWPGNVRQLVNVIEQCVALTSSPVISDALVEQALEGENTALPTFVEARNQFELNYLRKLLQITKGNVTHAARMAGRNRTEFYKLLSRHELDANDFKE
mgnify:CR=1 FL=1